MKIRFKDEQAMDDFANYDFANIHHNHAIVRNFGMNSFEVEINKTGEYWDTNCGEFTIHIEDEQKYFIIEE